MRTILEKFKTFNEERDWGFEKGIENLDAFVGEIFEEDLQELLDFIGENFNVDELKFPE